MDKETLNQKVKEAIVKETLTQKVKEKVISEEKGEQTQTHKKLDKRAIFLLLVLWLIVVVLSGCAGYTVFSTLKEYNEQEEKYTTYKELRPCPFCGSSEYLEYEEFNIGGGKQEIPDMTEVRCTNCNARVTMYNAEGPDVPGAIEIWNSRK